MAEQDPQITVDRAQALEPEAPPAPAKAPRRWGKLALMAVVPLLVAIGAVVYWQGLQGKVSTDNAYVQQDKVSISAEVGGKIVEVAVHENQQVKAGDLLFLPEGWFHQVESVSTSLSVNFWVDSGRGW